MSVVMAVLVAILHCPVGDNGTFLDFGHKINFLQSLIIHEMNLTLSDASQIEPSFVANTTSSS
jgi:hypothetical protein